MRMPISRGGGARFRGPTSSHEYNQNIDDKYLDLLELYKQSNDNLQQLQEAYSIILTEHAAMQNYTTMLEQKIKDLTQRLDGLPDSFSKTAFVHQMTTQFPNSNQDQSETAQRCDIHTHYRYVTIPMISDIPKTHAVNDRTGEIMIPNELKLILTRSNTGGEVNDNDIYRAFNGDNNDYWMRTVSYDFATSPAEEDVMVEIELPSHLVNNLQVNSIYIHPHPERGIQIKNVEVHYQNSWQTIAGFTQQEVTAISSQDFSPRKKWFFAPIPVQRIRITLVQRNPLDIGGKKIFVLGAQEIGVTLNMFEQGGGIVLTPFEMSGVYSIESIEHLFMNRTAFSFDSHLDNILENQIYEFEIMKQEADGTLTTLSSSEWTNQFARQLWVKTKLYPDPNNGVAPCLHAIRLNYSR